jgi:argininosuccinate lyase
LVRLCEQRKCRLADLPPSAFDDITPGLSADAASVLGVANALMAFRGFGSTAPADVNRQLLAWRTRLNAT